MSPSETPSSRLRALLPDLIPIAALPFYLFLWPDAPFMAVDSGTYQWVAQDMMDGRLDQLHFRAPGFPLLLALTGSAFTPTRALFVVSLVLYLLGVLLLLSVVRGLENGDRIRLPMALLLVMPPYLDHSAYVLTETLSGFFVTAGFWMLVRKRSGVGRISSPGRVLRTRERNSPPMT